MLRSLVTRRLWLSAVLGRASTGGGFSKPRWGIHGTDEPSRMARVETNGCVRMTNWDVLRLARLVKPGIVVEVQP